MANDDVAEIGPDGAIKICGPSALLRLQAKAGAYHVLPSPDELLLWKRAGQVGTRPCLVCGEISAPGILCDVLSFVGHTGWRGELVLHDGTSMRSLFFEEGHVVGAQSTVVRERLGEVLYRYGALSREQVAACGDALADGNVRFGEAAVKLGFLTREELFGLMGRQPEEIFYGLLLVASGTYFFLEGFDEAQLSSRHKLSLPSLMRDGIRRMHEMRYFRARIPSEDHVPVRKQAPGPVGADVAHVFDAIDGARTVSAICRTLRLGEFEVTRALFHLVQTGHAEVRSPALGPAAIVDIYNAAIALLLRELDAMDEGDAVREQLAKFAGKAMYAPIFAGAGPADDGTLDPKKVTANVTARGAPPNAPMLLASWLHEYASYALFLARPHLARLADAQNMQRPRVSTRVSALLDPIAPSTDRAPRFDPQEEP